MNSEKARSLPSNIAMDTDQNEEMEEEYVPDIDSSQIIFPSVSSQECAPLLKVFMKMHSLFIYIYNIYIIVILLKTIRPTE